MNNSAAAPFTFRPTRTSDLTAYRELRLEALRLHPEAFGSDYETCLAWPEERWRERVEQGAGGEHGITYVAEAAQNGSLVGMTGVFREDAVKTRHAGLIVGVYVQKAGRGRGVADALLGACLDWARERGLRCVKLAVVTTNAPAIRLYVRHGFSVYGVEPEAIFTGGVFYDELLMVRRLP